MCAEVKKKEQANKKKITFLRNRLVGSVESLLTHTDTLSDSLSGGSKYVTVGVFLCYFNICSWFRNEQKNVIVYFVQ